MSECQCLRNHSFNRQFLKQIIFLSINISNKDNFMVRTANNES